MPICTGSTRTLNEIVVNPVNPPHAFKLHANYFIFEIIYVVL